MSKNKGKSNKASASKTTGTARVRAEPEDDSQQVETIRSFHLPGSRTFDKVSSMIEFKRLKIVVKKQYGGRTISIRSKLTDGSEMNFDGHCYLVTDEVATQPPKKKQCVRKDDESQDRIVHELAQENEDLKQRMEQLEERLLALEKEKKAGKKHVSKGH